MCNLKHYHSAIEQNFLKDETVIWFILWKYNHTPEFKEYVKSYSRVCRRVCEAAKSTYIFCKLSSNSQFRIMKLNSKLRIIKLQGIFLTEFFNKQKIFQLFNFLAEAMYNGTRITFEFLFIDAKDLNSFLIVRK